MTTLNEATLEDLKAELFRRTTDRPGPPRKLENPDFSGLIRCIESGVAEAVDQTYMDEDFHHYVYEAAVKAVYGDAYFKWLNSLNG